MKTFDIKTDPAALLKVMPVCFDQAFPVAVFIKYHDSKVWRRYSREYQHRKCAVNKARMIEIEHFAYYFPENSVYD